MKKSELIKIIKEEVESILLEEPKKRDSIAGVVTIWMGDITSGQEALAQQKIGNSGLDALIKISNWFKSAAGKAYLDLDNLEVKKLIRMVNDAIQFKQAKKGA